MAKRPFGFGGSKKSRSRTTKNLGKGSKKPAPKNNLYTKGGEFTKDGKPYVGDYHIMDDGRAMTGKRHLGKGMFGLRSKRKRSVYLEPVPKDTPADTPKDNTPTPQEELQSKDRKPIGGLFGRLRNRTKDDNQQSQTKLPKPLPAVDLSGIINQPYKSLESFGNQYPATDSSVKQAANTNVKSYYGGGTVKGHLGNNQSIPGDSVVLSASSHPKLNIDFIVRVDGTPYTSSQMLGKINSAKSEGNWYYINSVPVIDITTSAIKPYGNSSTLFKQEEDYAFNSPTDQIDGLDELMESIDWTCRKQATLEEARPYTGRYETKDAVAARLDIDAVIASANKPPKIRWRRS